MPGAGESATLAELLEGMAGSSAAAASILERVAANPEGAWSDFEAPARALPASGPTPVGAFHALMPLPEEQQILIAWYGQRPGQIEDRCYHLQADLERARRALAEVESGLRRERGRVEVLLEACVEPASIQDPAYRIIAQNGAHRRIFGERRGHLCHEVYRGRETPCEGCPMPEALATRQRALLEDRPDQGPLSGLEVLVRALPLFAPDHSPGGIVEVLASPNAPRAASEAPADRSARSLRDHEMEHILETLARTGGNRAEAARQLGISRATLWRRLGSQPTRRSDPPRTD